MPVLDMRLVRYPRSVKRMSPQIRKQVKGSYHKLGAWATNELLKGVMDWHNIPKFGYKVTITKKRYTLEVKYDARTVGGKNYRRSDKGTGTYREDGKGTEYKIRAKKKKSLYYELPTPMPKNMAADGTLAPSYTADSGTVRKKAVTHLGIKPRKLSQPVIYVLKSRKSGSFHNVTEAAIKRGLRQMGKKT